MKSIGFCLLLAVSTTVGTAEHVRSEQNSPKQLVERAASVVGIDRSKDRVLHLHAMQGWEMNFQSDRSYPPYFSAQSSLEIWYNSSTRVQRTATVNIYPGVGPTQASTTLVGPDRAGRVRDTLVTASTGWLDLLNVWAVLQDWVATTELQYAGREVYRDFPRDVVTRVVNGSQERLFLDPETGFPVKVEHQQQHYLWGTVTVEYLYSTWLRVGTAYYPSASFKIVDGKTERTRTVGTMELLESSKVPVMDIPAGGRIGKEIGFDDFPIPPADTVTVTRNTFLTVTPVYTEAMTRVGDTVYVFDATTGESRAKQDEAWLQKLFPYYQHVVVVVTDLAWPHIAGVRYWVSRGATIVSHETSKEFLTEVIERRWHRAPDELEKKRGQAVFSFIPVRDSFSLANGKIMLYTIGGIGSEGALMAFLPEEGFLWASDYIQDLQNASAYTTEVITAVKRLGIKPLSAVAQHIPLTPWEKIVTLE